MYICPVCGSHETGKINTANYYCRACMKEYNLKKEVFEIDEDGNLCLCATF